MKYVLVTGGVVSGLGKGVTASSIGVLLKSCGFRVTSIKIDPYLNTDAGTMSPFEHGEVFVLDDGGEVDLDLGNYERFLDIKLTRDNNITTGKIYQSVIDKERRGDYLGKTVQVVPHITDEIQEWIERVAMNPVDGTEEPADVCVIELGGTIGDIESMPFIEALGQFSYRVGPGNFCLVHVSLVPVLNVVGEQKTKPTQHSVRGLRGLGLMPDILACRSTQPLEEHVKVKLAQFCHVPIPNIINLHDVTNIWHIPLLLRDQKAHEAILKVLDLQCVGKVAREPQLSEWTERASRCDRLKTPRLMAVSSTYSGDEAMASKKPAHPSATQARNRKGQFTSGRIVAPTTHEPTLPNSSKAGKEVIYIDGSEIEAYGGHKSSKRFKKKAIQEMPHGGSSSKSFDVLEALSKKVDEAQSTICGSDANARIKQCCIKRGLDWLYHEVVDIYAEGILDAGKKSSKRS